jgi:hypothetical protein
MSEAAASGRGVVPDGEGTADVRPATGLEHPSTVLRSRIEGPLIHATVV